jgi:predicted ATPase
LLNSSLRRAHPAAAEVPPEKIYAAGDGTLEFQRTVSRLIEMRVED